MTINYVMFPSQAKHSAEAKEISRKMSVGYHEEKCIFVKNLKRYKRSRTCKAAGHNYYHWMPNGDVYACVTGWYYNMHVEKAPEFYMGNLFDGTFKPFNKTVRCNLACVMACDLHQRGLHKT